MGNTMPTLAVVGSGSTSPHVPARELILINPDGSAASTVKKQAAQADSTATDVAGLKTDFNALLAKLRLAGVIS